MVSLKLIKEVLKEARYFPRHAYKVGTSRAKNGVFPHEKFTFGKAEKQYLCWFEPKKVTQDKIIIFYHGGGWTFGTPELFSDRAKLFMDQGYIVVMPAHRKLPKFWYPHIKEDLGLALKKVRSIMQQKDILDKKILVGGMSSGGNLAALMLLDQSIWADTGFKSNDFVGGFFCGAPLDLNAMTDSFVLASFAGKRNSETFQLASPISHLPESINKPILIVHGTRDGLVNYQCALDFVEKLRKVNKKPIDFYTIPKGSHLKAVSWAYEDNEVRQHILTWLSTLGLQY